MRQVKLGIVDRTVTVFIPDPASTDGSGKTGLVAADLTVSFTRVETDNDVTVTDATSSLNNLASLTAAHNDWGVLEVSSSLAPGLYRLDIADAVFASGAWEAVVYVEITSSAAAASPIGFELVAYDPLDTVRMGLTALPNAAAEASGGLYTRGTGAGQINQATNGQIDSNLVRIANVAVSTSTAQLGVNVVSTATDAITSTSLAASAGTEIAAAVWQDAVAGDFTVASSIGKALYVSNVVPGAAGGHFIAGTNAATTITTALTAAITGNITGNLSGSVGSVTGAVGSVTGAVGSIASGGIAAASFAAGAIDAAAIATDAIGSAELAASAVTEIQTGLATSASISALNNLSSAQVNAEVVNALNVDTYAEPGQGTPSATLSIAAKVNYLFKAWRNKKTQSATTHSLFNAGGATVDQKSTVSDDGTTATRGEVATGP